MDSISRSLTGKFVRSVTEAYFYPALAVHRVGIYVSWLMVTDYRDAPRRSTEIAARRASPFTSYITTFVSLLVGLEGISDDIGNLRAMMGNLNIQYSPQTLSMD